MKKQIFIISIVYMTLHADSPLEERFEDAITHGQMIVVSQLLRDLDQDTMPLAQKKSLITDLSELAEAILESKKSDRGLFRNIKDCASGTIGSLVAVGGLLYLGHACYELYQNYRAEDHSGNRYSWETLLFGRNSFTYHAGASVIPAFLGTYIAYKGLTCSTQKTAIKRSMAICEALECKKVEWGL